MSCEGYFVNNYENFIVWVNKVDHLELVSAARGRDIKYVLVRLQKVIAKIEETLKVRKVKTFQSLYDKHNFYSRVKKRPFRLIKTGLSSSKESQPGTAPV